MKPKPKTDPKYKTIRISEEVHDLLARQGGLKDSFDSVIKKLLQEKGVIEED